MRRSMTFFFLLPAIAVQGYCEDIYLNKKVKTRERIVQSIIILPSNTYVKRSGETGRVLKESMKSILKGPFGKHDNIPAENPEDKSDALSMEIDNIVSKVLRDRGWKVNDNAFSSEILQKDEKKSLLVEALMAKYEILVRQMISKPKDTAKGRYSLGKDIANLGANAPVDMVALIYGTSHWIHKGGINPVATFKDANKSPKYKKDGEPSNVFLHISLLDSSTGEVLCYLQIPGAVGERISKELKKIP